MRKISPKYLFLGGLLVLALGACLKKKTYSPVPEIEYKEFRPYVGDSGDFVIKFSDGDGNIGVGTDDTLKTMYVNYYYRDTITGKYVGYFSTALNDTLRTGYIVRKPSDAYRGKPISGEISVRLQQYRHSKKIKHIKYVSYLLDADGNKSNVITSPELDVP